MTTVKMFHPVPAPLQRCAAVLVPFCIGLSVSVAAATPLSALSPQESSAGSTVHHMAVSARVDVIQGRSVLVTQAADPLTLRRGESKTAHGNAQLQLAAGCRARVSIVGEMSLDVFGPTSLEWRSGEGGAGIVFHELGWADVDVRSGQHKMRLPADWHVDFGRTSFHLRSLAGGPTELRHNAGTPISVEWLGDRARVRPPVALLAGSSVRLDNPRYDRTESVSASQDSSKAWDDSSLSEWPWREASDTSAQVREREILRRETQVLDEVPGSPKGNFTRLRAYEVDGSSSVRPLKRRPEAGQTYAQVPIMPIAAPRYEITTRPIDSLETEAVTVPRRPSTDPVPVPEMISKPASSTQVDVGVKDVEGTPGGEQPATAEAKKAAGADGPKVAFDTTAWRGLALSSLNGVNEIAAERGSGVELRVLGAGRTKVFVSASSPSARWCFSPTTDYLMSPGAVAVFEENGELRMSFGEIEEKAPRAGRPSFSAIAK